MSELDRFKRRLVRSVSRMLLRERRPPDEVWETLRKGTGKDCKELWTRMRALTLKKLARLLAADDYPAKVASVARMTPTDWLMYDLALVHEDIDVIDQNNKLGKHSDKGSALWALMRLAITFNVDSLSGARLASVWISIARNYNSNGRECSPMLLQRRWYQLKQTSREKFYVFWMVWKGKNDNNACKKFAPTRVQAVVAKCNPHLITHPFSNWEELKAQGKVVLAEHMQAIIRDANKSQNPEKEAENDKEPEVILMEPKIPTIDLGADSDDEATQIDTQAHTDKDIETTREQNTSKDNTAHNNSAHDNLAHDYSAHDNSAHNNIEYDNTQVRVKSEPLEQDCLANIQILQATHVPTEEIDNENENDRPVEVKPEVYDDITVTDTVLQKPIETNFVLPNTAKSVEDDISFDKEIIETNIMFENSDEEDDIIMYDDKDKNPEKTDDVTVSKEVESTALSDVAVSKQVERTAASVVAVSNEVEDSDVRNELDFVDDGIDIDEGDEGEYLDGSDKCDDSNDQLDGTKVQNRHETSGDENLAKIDLKLIMKPVVYTMKLDQMVTLKDKPYDAVVSKDIIDAILNESKPVTKLVEIKPEQNTSVASLSNDDKHTSDDIIKLAPPIEMEVKVEPQSAEVSIRTEEQTNFNEGQKETDVREESESESDEDVERISPKAAMFRKPKVKEYSPIQLCKNPDFNTRLKRLNVMFYAYETNRRYLKEIKPMTIDLAKTFESKLVHNTIYLKPEEPKVKIEENTEHFAVTTAMAEIAPDSTSSLEQMTPINHSPIDIKYNIVDNDKKPVLEMVSAKTNTSPNLSVKCVTSVHNPAVKFLEVAMNLDQYEDRKPFITETNSINISSVSSQADQLVTEAKTMELDTATSANKTRVNEMVVNSVKSLPGKLGTHVKPDTLGIAIESVIANSVKSLPDELGTHVKPDTMGIAIESVIEAAMNSQPPRKTIAKKKVTNANIPWYRAQRAQRPAWCMPTKTKTSCVMTSDSLLTIDTLNKMLNFCLEEEGGLVQQPQQQPTKKKHKQPTRIPESDRRYCCWIKEMYSTKEFGRLRAHPCIDKEDCSCCCRRNFAKSPTNPTPDTKETTTDNKMVEELKDKPARRKSATTSKKDNIETITLDEPKDNDIELNDDTNYESADNDNEVNEPSTTDEIIVKSVPKKKLIKKSKTTKANKKYKSTDTNTVAEDTEKALESHVIYKDTIFYTDDTESMQDHQEMAEDCADTEADAEEIDITTVDPPELAPLIVTKVRSRTNVLPKSKPTNQPLLYNNIPVLLPSLQVQNAQTPPPLISPNKPLIKITLAPQNVNLTKIQTFSANNLTDIPIFTDATQNPASPSPQPICIELSDDEGDVDYQPPRHALPASAKTGRRGRPRKTPLPTIPRSRSVIVKEPESCIPKLINDSTNEHNLCILKEFVCSSPFQVGRNRILLTTAHIPSDLAAKNKLTLAKVTATVSAPLVALPLGIRFAATQYGELSCFVDLKLFDMRKFIHLPDIVERVRNQLNCNKIPIIYSAETEEDVNNIVKKLGEFQNKQPDAIAEVNVSNETININTEEGKKDTDVVNLAETTNADAEKESSETNDKSGEQSISTEENSPKIDQDKSNPEALVEIDEDTGETRDITLCKDQSEIVDKTIEQEKEVTPGNVKSMLKVKDFAAVKEDDTTETKKTILSDLMEMSGISADDTLPEPPLVPEPPPEPAPPAPEPLVSENLIKDNIDEEPTNKVVYQAIQGIIHLTPVASIEILKFARKQKAKFFRLDLQHGTIVPTEVSIILKDKVKKLPKNAVVVDLTKPNKEIVEIHSQGKNAQKAHLLVSTAASRKPGIFQKRRADHKTYLDQLRNIWNSTKNVKLPSTVTRLPNTSKSQPGQKQPRKEKIATRIDMLDSDEPMDEEFLDSSDEETPQPKVPEKRPILFDSSDSDDEPLAKKVSRKSESVNKELNTDKASDDTNKSDDEFEEDEPEGKGSFSIEGLMDEIMSDDEDFILGA